MDSLEKGLKITRLSGFFLAFGLSIYAIIYYQRGHAAANDSTRLAIIIIWLLFSIGCILPWKKFSKKIWVKLYVIFILIAIAFVFSFVVKILFDYIAADSVGERLSVPGLEGTVIFLGLLQIPAVLFSKNPDWLR